MMRRDLTAEITRRDTVPESWGVEAIDTMDDGAIELTIFSGPRAKLRAIEYAATRYTEHRILVDAS
jgi:hypothetical protein